MNNFLQNLDPSIPKTTYVNIPLELDAPNLNHLKALKAKYQLISCSEGKKITQDQLSEDIGKFDKQIEETSNIFARFLRDFCLMNPHCAQFTTNELLLYFFERRAQRHLVNNPEDETFKSKWIEFKEIFCQARFTFSHMLESTSRNDSLLEKIRSFSDLIQAEYNKTKPSSDTNETQIDGKHFELIKSILDRNEILLDIPVAVFAGISNTLNGKTKLKTCIPYILKAYNHRLSVILNNLPWVLETCERKLAPFLTLKQDKHENYSKELCNEIKKIKSQILPKLQYLYLESPPNCSAHKLKILSSLHEMFKSWVKEKEDGCGSHVTKKNGKWITQFISIRYFFIHTLQTRGLENHLEELKQKELKNLPPTVNKADLYEDENIKRTTDIINFHQAADECASLISNYFRFPVLEMSNLYEVINDWNKEEEIRQKRTAYDEIPVDQMIAKIEGTPRKKRPKNKKQNPSKPTSKVTKSTPLSNSSSSVSVIKSTEVVEITPQRSPLNPMFYGDQITHLLAKATESSKDPFAKGIARQAHMYLSDLNMAYKNLMNSSETSSVYSLINLLHFGFFYLEQLLNYQAISLKVNKNELEKEHNLNYLLNQTDLSLNKEGQIIRDLFLANFWIRSTYEQIQQRERDFLPPYLNTIRQIYEANQLSHDKFKSLVSTVQEIYHRIIKFSLNLPVMVELGAFPENIKKIEVEIFTHETEIDVEKCKNIAKKCQGLFNRTSPIWHPKLKQIISHLEIIKDILQEINKKKISSDVFSLHVRNFLFWENTVLEELMQLAVGTKTGIDTYSHNLLDLYDKLATDKEKETNESDRKFLKEKMNNVHNLSRYPFIHEGSEFCSTIIRQAELFRERPELGLENRFSIQENHTNLNFLQVCFNQFTPKEVVEALRETHEKIFQIISERVFPKISLAPSKESN